MNNLATHIHECICDERVHGGDEWGMCLVIYLSSSLRSQKACVGADDRDHSKLLMESVVGCACGSH